MWDKIVQGLPKFSSAVLTGLDADGYPFSLRCQPEIDHARQVIRVQFPPSLPIQAGAAGLLCHAHDEQLWNLNRFAVRGKLEKDGEAWIFRPEQFSEGEATGLAASISFVTKGRRATSQYLKKRNLPRPRIPWDEIDILKK